jgi:peptidoglycan/LPS O-acetylase OafA/YrhL
MRSLSTEVAFYLALPLLMWLALPRRRSLAGDGRRFATLVVAMVVVNVVWLMDLSVRLDNGGSMIRLWLPSYLTWFATGLVVAAAQVASSHPPQTVPGRQRHVATVLQHLGRSPLTCWIAALTLLAIASTPVAGPADLSPATLGAALTKNLLYAAIAGLVLLPGVFAGPGQLFSRVFSLAPLRHVGHLSYGLFCVHLVVLELVAQWRDIELFGGRGLELFALTLVISLVVSEVLYRLIERPLMRWKNLGRGSAPTSTATSAPTVKATRSCGATSAPAQPSSDPSGRSQ